VVRDLCQLLRCGLGRTDIHVAVYLAAIGADNLSLEKPGQVDSQPALADARGADNSDETSQFNNSPLSP
jgi:hypothetical protein